MVTFPYEVKVRLTSQHEDQVVEWVRTRVPEFGWDFTLADLSHPVATYILRFRKSADARMFKLWCSFQGITVEDNCEH